MGASVGKKVGASVGKKVGASVRNKNNVFSSSVLLFTRYDGFKSRPTWLRLYIECC